MTTPQFNSADSSTDIPLYDVDVMADDPDSLTEDHGGRTVGEGRARRQLEDRQEAQKLRRLLADYAWDDRDIS